MYSLKFNHYFKSKTPDLDISEFYTDLCIPGKLHQKFFEKTMNTGTHLVRVNNIEVTAHQKGMAVSYSNGNSKTTLPVDMIILSAAIEPRDDTPKLAKILGIPIDSYGFFEEVNQNSSSVATAKQGVFIVGCSQGPKNIQDSVAQANAAVGKILAASSQENV